MLIRSAPFTPDRQVHACLEGQKRACVMARVHSGYLGPGASHHYEHSIQIQRVGRSGNESSEGGGGATL